MRATSLRKAKALGILFGLLLAACGPTMRPERSSLQALGKAGDGGQLVGVVEEIAPGSLFVNGERVLTTDTTMREGIAVGDSVQIQFSLGPDGEMRASSIELSDPVHEEDFEFTGTVVSMDETEWVIAGKSVQVDASTEIEAEIQQGDFVKVHAVLDDTGSLVGREIELVSKQSLDDIELDDKDSQESGEELEFIGAVDLIEGDRWTIDGKVVLVSVDTEVKGELSEGSLVEVHATLTPEGDLLATEIEPVGYGEDGEHHQGGQEELEIQGFVTEMGAETWMIDARAIQITPETKIDLGIQVGDLVEVKALYGEADALIALDISLENHNDDDIDQNPPYQGNEEEGNDDYEEMEDSSDEQHGDDEDAYEEHHEGGYGGEYGDDDE
jgi:hypothetical protein